MPLFLVTGAPGHGKTQWTLWHLEKEFQSKKVEERRRVFYHGIPELTLDWEKLDDPTQLGSVPDGSIIVIDEAQKIYRTRGSGAAVPAHVSYLETHRHQGHDVFIITQHPLLIDQNVRRLVDTHYHVQRPFGLERTYVHRFVQVNERPDRQRAGSIKTAWKFSPEVQSWYKSAEVHTVKRSIPGRVWFLISVPLILVVLIYIANHYLSKLHQTPDIPSASALQGAASEAPPRFGAPAPVDLVALHQPRVLGLAYTAPIYDQVNQVVVAPKPSMCVSSAALCTCYTSQATPLQVPDAECRDMALHGWFDPSRIEPASGPSPIASPASPVSTLPLASG